MIFVTVGTHEQPFTRLVQKMDMLKQEGIVDEDVVIQTGFDSFEPKHCSWSAFFSYNDMKKNIVNARIVITHGGPASFIMPIQYGKIPIVVPRQYEYGEHVNNHQVEFIKNVSNRIGNIIPVYDVEDLNDILPNFTSIAEPLSRDMSSNNTKFNRELERIVRSILK